MHLTTEGTEAFVLIISNALTAKSTKRFALLIQIHLTTEGTEAFALMISNVFNRKGRKEIRVRSYT